MHRSILLHRAATLWLAILLVSACTTATATPTPFPTGTTPAPTATPTATPIPGPVFEGRLLVEASFRLFELAGTSSSAMQLTQIASGVTEVAVSPGKRYLAYSTSSTIGGASDQTVALDLQTGERMRLTYADASDLRWSPDSQRLSFTATVGGVYGLYISDLMGKTTLVYQPPSATYRTDPQYKATTVCGGVTAGTWLDASHLLFRRYVGEMPLKISSDRSEIAPNTTTVASLDEGPVLGDYPDRRLLVEDICENGLWILFREAGQTWLLARAAANWDDIDPQPFTPCPECGWGLGFMPDSCDVYYVHAFTRNNHFNRYIYFASPDTLQSRPGPALELENSCPNAPGRLCKWDWEGVWVGDPARNVIAVREEGWQNGGLAYFITVVDLNTMGVTRLLEGGAPGLGTDLATAQVLVWLPPK